ncbi:protein kinase [Candidatus Woesearchaeota archaeon]|nr:protein kinase [Candidatus Woesearchaeota archaeon]
MDLEQKIANGLEHPLEKGMKVEGYVILAPKEESFNSIIYEAVDTTRSGTDMAGKRVLLKGLNYKALSDMLFWEEQVKARLDYFDEEIEIMNRLSHPNIVRSYPAITHRGINLIPMECISGKFSNAIEDLPLKEIVLQGCDALEYLAAEEIVHSDFKPSNFLYSPEEKKIKLIDFGIAVDLKKSSEPKGFTSQEYVPPETWAEGKVVVKEYDIFSFGHLLDKAWQKKFPKATTDRDAPTDVGGKIKKGAPGIISTSDAYLKAIVGICTEIDPRKRDLKLIRELALRM